MVYQAAMGVPCRRGCTVPPWGVPCRHGCTVPPAVPCRRGCGPARAPGWKEHQRRPLHSPCGASTVVFGVCRGRAPGKEHQRRSPISLMGLDGARKVRPAHQLFLRAQSPLNFFRAQLTNFTRTQLTRTVKKSARLHTSSSPHCLQPPRYICGMINIVRYCRGISLNLKTKKDGKR
jgi:hypothetical protein